MPRMKLPSKRKGPEPDDSISKLIRSKALRGHNPKSPATDNAPHQTEELGVSCTLRRSTRNHSSTISSKGTSSCIPPSDPFAPSATDNDPLHSLCANLEETDTAPSHQSGARLDADSVPGVTQPLNTQVNSSSTPFPVSVKFWSEISVENWKHVGNRSVWCEQNLDLSTAAKAGIVEFLDHEGLLGSVTRAKSYSIDLVREFYANLAPDITDPSTQLFHKVYVRGRFFDFSPELINDALDSTHLESDRPKEIDETLDMDLVVRELTEGALSVWTNSGFRLKYLKAKYPVLFQLLSHNWSPCTHSVTVFSDQARLLYMIGTGVSFSLGKHIFDIILGYINWRKSFGYLPFPCLISQLLLQQHDVFVLGADVTRVISPLKVSARRLNKLDSSTISKRSSHGKDVLKRLASNLNALESHARALLHAIKDQRSHITAHFGAASSDSE